MTSFPHSYFNLNPTFLSTSLPIPAGTTVGLGCPPEGSWPEIFSVGSSGLYLTGTPPSRAWAHPENTSAPPTKRVRNRNTVRIECEPCKRIFTRICIYRAHLKTRKHAVNLALSNAGTSLERVTSTPTSLDWSSQFSPPALEVPETYTSTAMTPSMEAESDPIDIDFSKFDWSTLPDYSTSDSDSQTPVITPPTRRMALPEAPVEATLTIIGTSDHVIKGFYHPSANLFIPSGII